MKLYIVYCIDTEGPLFEPIDETFKRIKDIFNIDLEPTKLNLIKLQNEEIFFNGLEKEISKVVSPHLLNYNDTWDKIDVMLDDLLSDNFRKKYLDSNGNGIVYNWHCIDHVGFLTNERRRDIGYGNIFKYYKQKIKDSNSLDNIHWHFHPISFDKEAHIPATSYDNSMDALHSILVRRLINYNWFPIVNRAGFHTIRQDSSFFLEQWIPFDYSNQSLYEESTSFQLDLSDGRFGDWRFAPKEWKPYNPCFSNYQKVGNMNRYTTKCLNIGTRLRLLSDFEIKQAFELSRNEGKAILSFTNHDFRDMRIDIEDVYSRIFKIHEEYKDVEIIHSDAREAMQNYLFSKTDIEENKLRLDYFWEKNKLIIECKKGKIFGSQPYLAIKTVDNRYIHDNFDIRELDKSWVYTFDRITLEIDRIESIKVATNDKFGNQIILEVVKND